MPPQPGMPSVGEYDIWNPFPVLELEKGKIIGLYISTYFHSFQFCVPRDTSINRVKTPTLSFP